MNTIQSWLLFVNIIALAIVPSSALDMSSRGSSACPSPQEQCESTQLPSNFHCPLTSNCISLDNGSSAICCPYSETCATIQTIPCDVQLQNPASYPCSAVKTTRLDAKLPRCGQSCCPFGYACRDGSVCIIDEASAFTASPLSNFSISTSMTSASSMTTPSTRSYLASAASTADSVSPTASPATATPYPTDSTVANSLSGHNSTSTDTVAKCDSFPGKAVAAGFFPGVISGALATMLALFCMRRRPKNLLDQTQKPLHYPQKALDGPPINISSPISSEETSCRTDFLRFDPMSDGAPSRPSPTAETRVRRSLFCPSPKPNGPVSADTAPTLSVTCPPRVLRRREPSTESITVYTPPEIFAADSMANSVGRGRERDTTFTDMIQSMGFQNSVGEPCFRIFGSPPGAGETRGFQARPWDIRRNA